MSLAHPPLISIVIPTYEMKGQGMRFLDRCLHSIKKQTQINPQDIEVVICDQSRDGAIKKSCILQSEKFPFALRYHQTTTGKGIAAHNLNIGIRLSQGKYIKILFQDDLLVQDFYLKTLQDIILQQSPDCIFSGATHTKDGEHFYNALTPKPNPYFLFGNNTASSPSVLTVAKTILKKYDFDENLKMLFDCDFYHALFSSSQDIKICDSISVANGVWEGQTQFAISFQEFTQEVRYLNWKYPQAKLPLLLPSYQVYFSQLHPNASFPFESQISPRLWQIGWWNLTRKKSTAFTR